MESVTEIAEKMVRDFVEQRNEDVAASYRFPAVVFYGPDVYVLTDKVDFLSKVKAYRSVFGAKGLERITSVVQEVQVSKHERLDFQVRNAYYSKDDVGLTEAVIRYFLEERDGQPKIRMVEYLVMPFDHSPEKSDLFAMVH